MKLEFLDDISDGGKFTGVEIDQLVRLYDFDKHHADKFRLKIQHTVIEKRKPLNLSELDFIEKVNCNLSLSIADSDVGITKSGINNFICYLTISGYKNMVCLLEPFCNKDCDGYQWLYDIDSPIEFLFSASGSW